MATKRQQRTGGVLAHANVEGARKTAKDVTENTIETYLVKEVEAHGGLCIKLKTYFVGLFDRFIVWPCCTCHREGIDFVELKRPVGGHYGPGQIRWREKMQNMGYTALTIHTKALVDQYISGRKCPHIQRRSFLETGDRSMRKLLKESAVSPANQMKRRRFGK